MSAREPKAGDFVFSSLAEIRAFMALVDSKQVPEGSVPTEPPDKTDWPYPGATGVRTSAHGPGWSWMAIGQEGDGWWRVVFRDGSPGLRSADWFADSKTRRTS